MAVSRRSLLVLGALLVGIAVAQIGIPSRASAQAPSIPYRVAFVASVSALPEITGRSPANAFTRSFVEGLRERGYVEGRNLVLVMRTLEGKPERLDGILEGLAREKVSVVFLPSPHMAVRATQIVPGLPVVTLVGTDLIEKGIVKSFARPGGMITGPSYDVDEQVEAKRLEILLEVMPGLKRVAYVGTREEWVHPYIEHVRTAARRRGVTLVHLESEYAEFAPAFARLKASDAQAIFIERSSRVYGRRQQVGALAAKSGLPSVCSQGELADHGCLIAYGADNLHVARRVSDYMDRILKGAKPGDLPVEAPSKFELVINLKTARALGIEIPKAVLARADRFIQ